MTARGEQARADVYPKAVAVITVNLPSAEEEELIRRFTVNKNYLHALNHFLAHEYGKQDKLYVGIKKAVAARPQYVKIQRAPSVDLEQVRRYLLLSVAPSAIATAAASSWQPTNRAFQSGSAWTTPTGAP